MLNFLNQNSSAFLVVFSLIVALSTVFYAILTGRLVSETRKVREAQTEPNVSVTISSKEEMTYLKDILIQNIGLGTAYNIKFEVEPDFEYSKGRMLSEVNLIKNGLHYLAPNQKITFFIASIPEIFMKKEKSFFQIKVNYENKFGKTYKDTYPLDFSEFFDLRHAGEPPLQTIAKNLEKVQEDIHSIMNSSYPRIKVVAYTKKDMEAECLKVLEEERLFEEEKKKT
jgi:hypothetical protein